MLSKISKLQYAEVKHPPSSPENPLLSRSFEWPVLFYSDHKKHNLDTIYDENECGLYNYILLT
jgi:hypothetical protein